MLMAIGIGLTAAACSSAKADRPLQIGPVLQHIQPTDIDLPLEAYMGTSEQQATVESARRVLIRKCMAAKGYEIPFVGSATPDTTGALNGRRYGLIDVRAAASFGFREPNVGQPTAAIRQTNQLFNAHPSMAAAYYGVNGSGGCVQDVGQRLRLSERDRDGQFVSGLETGTFEKAEADARVQAALKRWRSCARAAGYQDASPLADSFKRFMSRPDSEQAISAAMMVAKCNQQSRLAATWLAVESAIQRAIVEDNAERLTDVQHRLDERTRLASEIVSRGG